MVAIKQIDNMTLVELRQLEYFVAVAAEMNFSRAAHHVHVVQSALSTSVGQAAVRAVRGVGSPGTWA
jgi:hypothetical protein